MFRLAFPLLVLLCLVLTVIAAAASASSSSSEGDANMLTDEVLAERYFFGCSGGKTETIRSEIQNDPKIVNARTKDGETCLHLASINQSLDVTKLLLQNGANPNARTLYEKGQRMHPLSWNVYGGNYEIVQALLDGGADVNADFDLRPNGAPNQVRVTALDVAEKLAGNEDADRFRITYDLLKERGGKKFEDLTEED